MAAAAWYDTERVAYKGSVILDKWNADRAAAKAATSRPHTRRFNAARVDRLTSQWMATTNSINNELRGDLDRLRARSRDLSKNNDYARKFKKMVGANLVGPAGFKLQARVMNSPTQADELANNAIEAGFTTWARRGVCEASGRMSFADLCRALAGDAAIDGEFIVRKLRGKAARNAFGYALQHIDVDRLDTNLNRSATSRDNAIVMGIEIDAWRRPVAYHLFTGHPSDNVSGGRDREVVPASEIIHGFVVEYAEQVRGAPWMSSAILTLHHLGEFEQSALLAARKGADTLGFFVSPDGAPPPAGEESADGEPITVTVPGHYDTLPDGYDFKPYDSAYPDAMLEAFCKQFVRRAASGLNVAYHGLGNDLEGVNFSSIRSGVLEERDQWMALQNWFTEALLDPVYTDLIEVGLLYGAFTLPNGAPLPAAKRDKFAAHQWQGRRWQWVDPLKDIKASLEAIRAGLTSPYAVASQMGLDLDDVMADLARANAAALAAGLPAYASAAPVAPPAPAKPKAKPAAEDADEEDVRAQLRALQTAFDAARAAPPVQHHIHLPPPPAVTVTSPEIRNDIVVQPAAAPVVEIRNEITAPAPVVEVHVEAIMPEQPAPQIDVTVELPDELRMAITAMPDRITTSAIARDPSSGNITATTQTEKDKE
jgi:lambda family phage portal protein